MKPILAGVGAVIGICLSLLVYFISPQTPFWFYFANSILLSLIGFLFGRYQDARVKEFTFKQDELSKRNQDLQTINEENNLTIEKFKETERKISHAKKTWEAIFDAVNDMIILTNEQNEIIRCNNAAMITLNLSFQELFRENFNTLFCDSSGNPPIEDRNIQFKNIL
jgi:PAS domain-containing protein